MRRVRPNARVATAGHLALGAWLLTAGFAPSGAGAVPPPPERPPVLVDVAAAQGARVTGEVRAYDAMAFELTVQRDSLLELLLDDAGGTLSVALESPSGAPLLEGARPGGDGMRVRLAEAGAWRVRVSMSADAARAGRSAKFALVLRARSNGN